MWGGAGEGEQRWQRAEQMGPRLFVEPGDNGASLGAGIRHEDLCRRAAGGQSLEAPPGGSCGPNPSPAPSPALTPTVPARNGGGAGAAPPGGGRRTGRRRCRRGGAGRARPRIPGIAAPEPGPRYRRGPQSAVPSFPERQHGRAAPPCPGKCRPPPPPRPRPTGAAQPRGEPRSSIPPPADVPVSPRRCPRRS